MRWKETRRRQRPALSSIPQCWDSSSASLGLRLSFYDCEGASCKPACSHNKTPDTGDVAPGYCTSLETVELERGGCSDQIAGAGGSGSSQQVDRQPAAGQAFLSAGVKSRELPKDTTQAPVCPEGGEFGVQGEKPGLPCPAGTGGWECWWDVQHLWVFSSMRDVVLGAGWAVSPERFMHLPLPEQVWIPCTSSSSHIQRGGVRGDRTL